MALRKINRMICSLHFSLVTVAIINKAVIWYVQVYTYVYTYICLHCAYYKSSLTYISFALFPIHRPANINKVKADGQSKRQRRDTAYH